MENSASHRDARALLRSGKAGVLSTLSAEVAGYPFGSVAPYCLDRGGRPLLLVSRIAQHTKNLAADPRICLTVTAGSDDVQAAARLSVMARAERSAGEDLDDDAERYTRHFPKSRDYHRVHDFLYLRLKPVRFRWIGGFGDIRWIEPEDLLAANPFSRDEETAMVRHMNDDHVGAMRSYCRGAAGIEASDELEVSMAGIDGEGFDLLAGGLLVRRTFSEPVTTPTEARQRLVELARSSRR